MKCEGVGGSVYMCEVCHMVIYLIWLPDHSCHSYRLWLSEDMYLL